LGDNLFHGNLSFFEDSVVAQDGGKDRYRARIFGYEVETPNRYGVVEFDPNTGRVISLEEKPEKPKSNYAISGLYIFDHRCVERTKNLKPSKRGELEITDLMKDYLAEGELQSQIINQNVKWLDAGTVASLFQSSEHVAEYQESTSSLVGSIHSIAFQKKFVDAGKFRSVVEAMPACEYRELLNRILTGERH
jgi:glucose-1-phosphate thymidylyltransferase